MFQKYTVTLNKVSFGKISEVKLKVNKKHNVKNMFKFVPRHYFIIRGIAMKKRLSVFLIAMLIGCLILVSLPHLSMVQAETSIPKPAVPEFTIKLVDSSYDIPPTSSVDPYTGQTVTQAGRHVESRTIKLYIKLEPITPFIVETPTGNWTAGLQYNIRWKGHFEQDWHEIYSPTNGFAGGDIESEYLAVSYEGEYSSEGLKLYYQGLIATFPPGGQVDFQVKAMIGYIHRDPLALGWIFTGEESDWSNTQTITIDSNPSSVPSSASSDSQNPTASSDQSGLNWTEIALFTVFGAIVVLLIVAITLIRRRGGLQNADSPLPKSNH